MTFWNILDVVEGCRKVDFQVDHRQTYRQTLGLVVVELCLCSLKVSEISTLPIHYENEPGGQRDPRHKVDQEEAYESPINVRSLSKYSKVSIKVS